MKKKYELLHEYHMISETIQTQFFFCLNTVCIHQKNMHVSYLR